MITLKTLPQATAQEVFDQVKNHLLTQGRKSREWGQCLYRGPNGTKCAAGCLIGDDEYQLRMDDCGLWDDLQAIGMVPDAHRELILALQDVHDSYPVEDWPEELQDVTKDFNLIYK